VTPTAALLDAIRAVVREELERAHLRSDEQEVPVHTRYGPRGCAAHRDLVAGLVRGGALVNGFRKSVEKAIGHRFVGAPQFIPDAYLIVREDRRIVLLEVEVSNGLTRSKLAKIQAWRDWLRGHGWRLRLVKVEPTTNGNCSYVGVDPESGDMDDESRQRVVDILQRRIEP
jgi:hypothetical protein